MSLTIPAPIDRRTGRPLPYAAARDRWSGEPGNETFSRTIHIPYAGDTAWRTLLPDQDEPLTGAPFLLYQSYQLNQSQEHGTAAELVLTYGQDELEFDPDDPEFDPDEPGQGIPPLPEDVISESDSQIEADIRAHRKWNTPNTVWNDTSMREFWDALRLEFPSIQRDDGTWGNIAGEQAPAALWGRTKFLVGSFTVAITEYSYGRPTAVQGIVGRRIVPPGYTGTTANWLVVSGSRNKQGGLWTRTVIYQFSASSGAQDEFFEWVYETPA
jgi:hypothetical protein